MKESYLIIIIFRCSCDKAYIIFFVDKVITNNIMDNVLWSDGDRDDWHPSCYHPISACHNPIRNWFNLVWIHLEDRSNLASFHLYIRHAVKVVGWMGVCIDRYTEDVDAAGGSRDDEDQVSVSQFFLFLVDRQSVRHQLRRSSTATHTRRELWGAFWWPRMLYLTRF